jgi:hypothetical protein
MPDVRRLVEILKEEGTNYIFDLLIGGPGETEETVKVTIQKVRELNVPLAGIATGVRVYPDTLLAKAVAGGFGKEGLHTEQCGDWREPLFYLSPYLGNNASALVKELVGEDQRFLSLASPATEGSYNYAGDEALCTLIKKGARGAYWEIIKHNRGMAERL